MASWAETICRVEENLCRKQPDEKLVDMMRLRRSAVLIKCTCHNDTESVQYSFEIYNLIVVKFKEIMMVMAYSQILKLVILMQMVY